MKYACRTVLLLVTALTVASCGDRAGAGGAGIGAGPDTMPAVPGTAGQPGAEPGAPGALAVRAERPASLREGQPADVVQVSASGPAHDRANVRLVIRGARGDTLWFDAWSTARYFEYDVARDRSGEEAAAYVQAQLDSLLHDSRFSARGMPAQVRQQDRDALRESIRYHLAELDWRNRANLGASDPTPPDAHDRISTATVAPERVDAVLAELLQGPTYWYYAGGEVTYVIGWSPREYAFVRLYSCC